MPQDRRSDIMYNNQMIGPSSKPLRGGSGGVDDFIPQFRQHPKSSGGHGVVKDGLALVQFKEDIKIKSEDGM